MKNIQLIVLYILITVYFFLAACGGNNNTPHNSKETAETHNDAKFNSSEEEDDAQFLVDAYSKNLFEIELSKHAKEKATRKDVKEFAEKIITADVRMNEELKKMADSKQISLQHGITDEQLDKIKEYGDKKGSEFDKSYMEKVADCHEKMVKASEKIAEKTTDADLHNLINSVLPEIRNQLDEALTIKDRTKA